jgi:glycosyltransferase involved in cell wall biosynthesis
MEGLVSVVVPTYNRPERLLRALKSVLSQEYSEFEILVVNDSSEEAAVHEVLDKLADRRINYFRNSRKKGANGARNTGILNAKGHYIAFLDDDDEWLPFKLMWQLEYLTQNPKCCGVFNAYKIKTGLGWITKAPKIEILSLGDVLLNSVSVGSSSNLIFRQGIFDEIGLWNEELIRQQDLELLARITVRHRIGFDSRVALMVMGHHDLDPEKAIVGHEQYYKTVQPLLEVLPSDQQKRFHSNHYRRLAMYKICSKKYGDAIKLYQRGTTYELVHPRKDLKNLMLFFKGIFGIN